MQHNTCANRVVFICGSRWCYMLCSTNSVCSYQWLFHARDRQAFSSGNCYNAGGHCHYSWCCDWRLTVMLVCTVQSQAICQSSTREVTCWLTEAWVIISLQVTYTVQASLSLLISLLWIVFISGLIFSFFIDWFVCVWEISKKCG